MRQQPDLRLITVGGRDVQSDPDLASAAQDGNEAAFAELVRRHQARVRGMARRLAGSPADGDDIAQAAFLTAWRKITTYSGGNFRSWLCTICYREFLQARRKRTEQAQERDDDRLADIDTSATLAGDRIDLARALATLPDQQRICVVMCVAAGLSHREICEATGWPLGTIKSHVTRGVAALRQFMGTTNTATGNLTR